MHQPGSWSSSRLPTQHCTWQWGIWEWLMGGDFLTLVNLYLYVSTSVHYTCNFRCLHLSLSLPIYLLSWYLVLCILHMFIYIYIYMYIYVSFHIHHASVCIKIDLHVYIYIYQNTCIYSDGHLLVWGRHAKVAFFMESLAFFTNLDWGRQQLTKWCVMPSWFNVAM